MKALLCKAFGPVKDLAVEEIPDPRAATGEVVVDISAAGLNFPDKLMVNGLYQVKNELPFIAGGEAAGIVRELGSGVDHLRVGDRVIILPMIGAFAEQCAGYEPHAPSGYLSRGTPLPLELQYLGR